MKVFFSRTPFLLARERRCFNIFFLTLLWRKTAECHHFTMESKEIQPACHGRKNNGCSLSNKMIQ